MALTIENKRLELEVRMKKNLMLKSQVPPTIQNKTNKKKSDKTVKPDKQASKAGKDSYIPTLKDLSADEKVVKKAAAITNQITNDTDDTDSTSDMESDSDTQFNPPIQTTTGNNDKPYVTFKDKQKRKAVSGESRASKDHVTFDVPWPHEYAHDQTKSINFQDRDFDLVHLIQGEVSIIHSVEKSSTSVLRQKHLINLLYLVGKFPFCESKDFHAEVLRSIELGQKSWSDSFSEEQAVLSPVKTKLSISQDKPTKSPICGAYQAGNCTQAGDHFGSYGDKKLLHVCRKCVRKGKDPTDSGAGCPLSFETGVTIAVFSLTLYPCI